MSVFLFGTIVPVFAKDIWSYTLIGYIRDKKEEGKDKKGKKENKKENKKDSQLTDIQLIASHSGNPLSMEELLEMGIVLTPDIIVELNNYGVDIPSKITCEPFTDITDPMHEWTQYDNKTGSVRMYQSGLVFNSKTTVVSPLSVTDFQFNPQESNFEFGLSFYKTLAEDNKYVGMVLDYENNKQFKAIVFSKKEFIFYTVDKGEISVVKQGLVKPGKFINTIYAKYEGSELKVLLNGLEVTTLNRISISSSLCGVIVSGKRSAICDGFYFNIIESSNEQ